MKLLLSSTGWEENLKIGNEFLKLSDKKPFEINVFLVTTATKKDSDWKYVKFTVKELEKIGIDKGNVKIFSLNKKVNDANFKGIDIIYVCGGNTFRYLDKIRKTGLDKIIKKLVKKGVGYFGVSAGSVVAGPNINIASPFDNNRLKLTDLRGLKLTNIIIAPHFDKKDKRIIKDFERKNNCRVFRLTDKQALLIEKGRKKLVE